MAEKMTMAKFASKVEELCSIIEKLQARVDELEEKRGPKSSREMTEADARRVLNGDMQKISHKSAAETLGLSYGQVYSCRGGYTFRKIHDEIRAAATAAATAASKK